VENNELSWLCTQVYLWTPEAGAVIKHAWESNVDEKVA